MGSSRRAIAPPPPPPPAAAPVAASAAPKPEDPLMETKRRIASGMAGRRSLFSTELGFGRASLLGAA